jgi:hypothetical protein
MNFAEAFGNTPNSRSNRARNNSNLQQRLDAKFWRSMNTAGCQLAGNCQPASTLFWHRKILRSYVSRADKRYGCASFGIAIAVNASLKEDDHLVEGRLIRLGAVRGDFGDEMPKML